MTSLKRQDWLLLATLALVMLVTRYHGLSPVWLPDASFAIFFIAALFVGRPLIFVGFAIEGVAIDYAAVNYGGVSAWCITVAYAALAIAYLLMWSAGRAGARSDGSPMRYGLVLLLGILASAGAYLIADGSFYWFSGRIPNPTWLAYWPHMTRYFASYVVASSLYIAVAISLEALSRSKLTGGAGLTVRNAGR